MTKQIVTARQLSSNDIFNDCVQEIKGRYRIKRTLTQNELVECAKHVLNKNCMIKGKALNLSDTKNYLICKLGSCENEKFCALFLDSANRILAFEVIFTGTINNTAIYPRVIVKKALELNAATVIVAHNHPNGTLKVSNGDYHITQELKDLLELIDVRLLDHIIVAGGKALSLIENRLM